MPLTGLKALLFDKDGTLVHFDRTWGPAAGAVMRTLAGEDTEALGRLEAISHYLPEEERFLPSSPLVAGSSAHYGPLWAQALGEEPTDAFLARLDALFSAEGLRSLTPLGRVRETLRGLHDRGLFLSIVTNDAEANARLQAEALGLLPLLGAIHGYDSGYGSKPGPGMIRAMGERFGFSGDEMAVVGDSAHDLTAARSAGARFILVRTGPAPVDEMVPLADLVLDSVDDLPGALTEAVPC